MTYRRMTEAELQTFVEEFLAFQTWRAFASYATDVYGPAVERIVVATGSEYNDEFSYLVVEAVEAYNVQGQQLQPDMTTDWWQTALRSAAEAERPGATPYDEVTFEDRLMDILAERRSTLPVFAGGYDVFLISQPPKRTHRSVYVPE
jgi:hypothetical protein